MASERRPKASVSPFKSESVNLEKDEPDFAVSSGNKHSTAAAHPPNPFPSTASILSRPSSSSAHAVHWRRDYQPAAANLQHQYSNPNGHLLPSAVDKISLRPNSINQAKRNSLLSENGGDEQLLAMLQAEQRRGKTHISFGRSWDSQLANGANRGGFVDRAKCIFNGDNDKRNAERSTRQNRTAAEQQPVKIFGGSRDHTPGISGGGGRVRELVQQHQQNHIQPAAPQPSASKQPPQSLPFASASNIPPPPSSPVKSASLPIKKVSLPPSQSSFDEFNKIFDQQTKTRNDGKEVEKKTTKTNEREEERKRWAEEEETGKRRNEEKEEEEKEREAKEEHEENGKGMDKLIEIEESAEYSEEEMEEEGNEARIMDEIEEGNTTTEGEKYQQEEHEDGREGEGDEEEDEEEEGEEGGHDCDDDDGVNMLDDIRLNSQIPIAEMALAQLVEVAHSNDNETHEQQKNSPTNSSSSSAESDEIQFDKSWHYQCPTGVQGILRRQFDKIRSEKARRRVKFDLIVLFLDSAYEGHYDSFVELAAKVDDLSVANSEGITALHFAICSNNQNIVQYLLDHGANVNALDVDGWSPLHCAASCNHLPMLRLLIENGACPFATTISKSETAAQIFEETTDYAAGVEYMELVEECMGEVNDRKVYAAYSYEAQNADELDFEEGDELRVLQKNEKTGQDGEEGTEGTASVENGEGREDGQNEEDAPRADYRLWWICEHTQPSKAGTTGLVPRNYLALFPSWKYRDRYQINFQLPPQQLGNCGDSIANSEEHESEANEENHRIEEQQGVLSVQNNKPLGHQELSTYA